MELMGVSHEAEMEQFLGSLLKGAWKGIKSVGSAIGKVAAPLKGIVKAALPIVAPMVGSIVPGVGTALGGVLGSVVSKALELEGEMEMEQEEVNFERARRLVRIAATAAHEAALALGDVDPTVVVGDPTMVVHQAVVEAARQHLPGADLTILERAAGGGHHHHHHRQHLHRQHHHRQHPHGMYHYGLRHHGMHHRGLRHHGLHHHHAGQWHRQHGKIVLDGI
jgi:hypothetical protein